MSLSQQSREKRIDGLLDLVQSPKQDEEVVSHWIKYLCVLVSGHLEVSVREILTERSSVKRCPQPVAQYMSKSLSRFQNAEFQKISELIRKFDGKWGDQLDALDDRLKSSVNSVVSNRHLIAHGGTSSMTRKQLIQWYQDVKEVIVSIDAICV